MRNKSDKTKKALRFGTGDGANYKPYIEVGEFGSLGTAACVVDYKTSRTVHLLSQTEVMAWYLLRWDDDNLDIKEQFPLPLEETIDIAKEYGLVHPHIKNIPTPITSDFLVERKGERIVISTKADISDANIKALFIEKTYWDRHNVYWRLIEKSQLNLVKYRNIRDVVYYYNDTCFPDKFAFTKHLISRKLLIVDMNKPINYKDIILSRKEEIERWVQLSLELGTFCK